MRVEDLDGPRVKAEAAKQMLCELAWLGLSWEEPVIYQTQRTPAYREALEKLISIGAAYPCVCSRKDIEQAASAPHSGEGELAYPGTCCGRFTNVEVAESLSGRPVAWRLRVNSLPVAVKDYFATPKSYDLTKICGDFVIYKNDGTAAYQLAVVVDDEHSGVNAIVRGDDLLDSAARQIHLRRLLGFTGEIEYYHLPLVVGTDGRRLAKRHGDTRLAHYRAHGTTPKKILGLLGYWSGILSDRHPVEMDELVEKFQLAKLPQKPIVFCQEDEDFLTDKIR